MSRLRKDAADGPPASAGVLPGGGALAGKPRKPQLARLARFLRTRPVTAAVLALGAGLVAMVAFGSARVVLHLVAPAEKADGVDESAGALSGRRPADFAALRRGVAGIGGNEGDGRAHLGRGQAVGREDANHNERVQNPEPVDQAALHVDIVKEDGEAHVKAGGGAEARVAAAAGGSAAAAVAAPRGEVLTDVVEGGCHRKFEPGFLGSNSTLCVTDEFYFDIALDEEKVGRLGIGVFGEIAPKSAANFRALATCTGAFADLDKCYRGDRFHRVVPDFVIQGGSKSTGRSIYGPTFREEQSPDHHSVLSHIEKGALSWAEYPIGSQFFILTSRKSPYLDKNHVLFGIVTDGMDVLERLATIPVHGDKPVPRISIIDCGDLHGAH